jgi:predicted nucleic acid-binding Zn ribbon protein
LKRIDVPDHFDRFCVICGSSFSGDWPADFTCSPECEQVLTKQERHTTGILYNKLNEGMPKAIAVLDELGHDEWVYFVRGESTGHIKIGYSTGCSSRLAQLQASAPERLVMVCTIHGDRRLEKQLHERFAKDRIHGEWFAPSAELLDFIDEIQEDQ